jgi:hypothetical protein
MNKPDHVSFSSLSQADNCLGFYKATRIDKVPEAPSKPREVGVLVHDMIAIDLDARFSGETIEDAAYAALVRAGSTANYAEAKSLYERWRSRFAIRPNDIVASESLFERELEGVPKVVGYPDVVYLDDHGIIVPRDFKSGWGGTITDDYAFQGDMMAWLIAGQWSTRPIQPEIEFIRTGEVKRLELFDGYRGAITEQRIRRVWARIEAAFDTNEWTLTPGKHCAWCPVAVSCAKGAGLAAAGGVLVSEIDAQAALVDVARLEAATKQLKGALKDFVSSNGPVAACGIVADYEHRESVKCTDPAGLIDAVGLEKAAPALSIDARTKAGKALRGDESLASFFGPGRATNTFKISGALRDDGDELAERDEVVA